MGQKNSRKIFSSREEREHGSFRPQPNRIGVRSEPAMAATKLTYGVLLQNRLGFLLTRFGEALPLLGCRAQEPSRRLEAIVHDCRYVRHSKDGLKFARNRL